MLIFSTGRGGENAARQLQKVIRRCQHARTSRPDDDLERAGRLLDGASALLDAAELLLTAADKRAHAEELLALAEHELTELQDCDALLDTAAQLDSESGHAAQQAAELTVSARYSPKRPFAEAAITDEAEQRVDQAERATAARVIADRIHALRARIDVIRARM